VILLDTHVLVWLSLEPNKLSKKARQAIRIERTGGCIAVAAISLWELAWLAENGRIQVPGAVETFIRDCVSKVIVRPITPEITARAVRLPTTYPKDPQDRLIGSTAIVEGIPLITADEKIRAAKLFPTIW
jgi:PIN domain nuclease of toxin-antitoxin system